ncbi:MAG: sulfite exporter TauE/SafE family protein [Dehalococcoidia bacterium]
MLELAGLALLGLVVGAYGTIIGAGGGFVLVPVLLILYPDLEPEEVTAISLGVVCLSALSGSAGYAWQRRIDYQTGLLFAVSSAPGVIAGAFIVEYFPARVFTGVFGLLLAGVAIVSVRSRPSAIREPLRGPGLMRRSISDTEGRTYVYAYRIWQGAVLSLGVGVISSVFGIGGGIIHVPAMTMLLHIPMQFAVATSLFILVFMSGGASAIHLATGTLGGDEAAKIAALAVGAVPGAQIGALLAQRIRGRTALKLLAGAIAVLGARLLVKAVAGV